MSGFVFGAIALGEHQDAAVSGERALDSAEGPLPAHDQRRHHTREQDLVA